MFGLNFSRNDKRSAALWMFGGVLLSSWLYGSWHAVTMHGLPTALAALLIPPYGSYMAGESEFGHPQRSKINWASPRGKKLAFAMLNNKCLINDERRQRLNISEGQYREFCQCAAHSALEILQPAASDNVAPGSTALKQQIIRGEKSCWATARYLPAD